MGILYAQLECWIIVSIQKHHGQNYILVPNTTRLGCDCSLSEITALTLFCWTNSSLNVTTTLSDSVQYQFFYFRWHLDVFCAECHAHVTCRCSPALMLGLPTQHGRQPYLTTAISSSPSPSYVDSILLQVLWCLSGQDLTALMLCSPKRCLQRAS